MVGASFRSSGGTMAKSKSTKGTETKATSRVSTPPPVMFKTPSHEDIAKSAYELYLQRGPQDGSAEVDWIKAETELLSH